MIEDFRALLNISTHQIQKHTRKMYDVPQLMMTVVVLKTFYKNKFYPRFIPSNVLQTCFETDEHTRK